MRALSLLTVSTLTLGIFFSYITAAEEPLSLATEQYEYTQATHSSLLSSLALLTTQLVNIQNIISANPAITTPTQIAQLRNIATQLREL